MAARLPCPARRTSRHGISHEVGFLLLGRCPPTGERSEVAVYCEHCGLRILPERPVCTRCGKSPTYEWIQLTSLVVILLAVIGNEGTGWRSEDHTSELQSPDPLLCRLLLLKKQIS